jgi:hypothetical protein
MIRGRGSVMQSSANHATAAASVRQEELVRQGARKATARLVPLLAVGYLVSYIDRTAVLAAEHHPGVTTLVCTS